MLQGDRSVFFDHLKDEKNRNTIIKSSISYTQHTHNISVSYVYGYFCFFFFFFWVTLLGDSIDDSRNVSESAIDMLANLFPHRKRSVLELILRRCDLDLLRAIEHCRPAPSAFKPVSKPAAINQESFIRYRFFAFVF